VFARRFPIFGKGAIHRDHWEDAPATSQTRSCADGWVLKLEKMIEYYPPALEGVCIAFLE